ncbi:hypothetical protein JTB14_017719 [Gonioctena quinquepunctata]|nr:hypothetical protein JTB14_017719 [Gonioctena quinquepunctata]
MSPRSDWKNALYENCVMGVYSRVTLSSYRAQTYLQPHAAIPDSVSALLKYYIAKVSFNTVCGKAIESFEATPSEYVALREEGGSNKLLRHLLVAGVGLKGEAGTNCRILQF